MKAYTKFTFSLLLALPLAGCLTPLNVHKGERCTDTISKKCYDELKPICESIETRNDPRCAGNYEPTIPSQ